MESYNNAFNYIDFKESTDINSIDNIIMKDRREQLISKRKEFIQNYRKKQRLLSSIESENYNNFNFNNNENYQIRISDIETEPDPITRIILLKSFFQTNPSKIDISFIQNNIKLIRSIFLSSQKILFDFNNNYFENLIIINKSILYCYITLLFEPEINPLMKEFDYEFICNLNTFCLYYLGNKINFDIKGNIIILHLYILLLLNNLIRIYPDIELLKKNIDIKNCIFLVNNIYFNFNLNNSLSRNNTNDNNNCINFDKCEKIYEFFEFTFLKLVENTILFLDLYDDDKLQLIDIIINFIYFNHFNNDIKILIYSLETLVNTEKTYLLLLKNKNFNKFLLDEIDNIIVNFNNNKKISDAFMIKAKLFFELYLQYLIFLIENNNQFILPINIDSFLSEKIIIFFKNYCLEFYESLIKDYKKEININEIKILVKIVKIFSSYFKLSNMTKIGFITLEQINKFGNILCYHFISTDNRNPSIYDILINMFIGFAESQEKYFVKICNLIINLFQNIYSIKYIEHRTDILYINKLQIILIEKYSLHVRLFPHLNLEKKPSLIENLLDLIKILLYFCQQVDIIDKKENSLYEKIKKELYNLNVFEEIENIESNTINSYIKFIAHQISENFLVEE